jgi:adenylate cyclase
VFNTACGVNAEHESRAAGAWHEAIMLGLSTRREGGFADADIALLEALQLPFALAAKAAIFKNLIQTLLRTYLGGLTGPNVLDGQVERGDGREIDCVLFYCDLRDSTRLAEQMPLDDYLSLINDYFDCTAGSVIAQGGEVLKFIGDAVMAIFPVDGGERPLPAMRRAAIAAAREALARRDRLRAGGRSQLDFGIALHVGKVKYGNVGTTQRLDFTVIGAPVNAVTRMEGLSKTLGKPLIASAEFSGGEETMAPLGAHRLAGIAGEVEVFTIV